MIRADSATAILYVIVLSIPNDSWRPSNNKAGRVALFVGWHTFSEITIKLGDDVNIYWAELFNDDIQF